MKHWENMIVTDVSLAMYVGVGEGKSLHTDRPFHGLVLSESGGEKRYLFSDGTVMEIGGGTLFYLPKDSNYQVKSIGKGGCYAINFQALGLECTVPFSVPLRDPVPLEKCFREVCAAWKEQRPDSMLLARRCLYEAVLCAMREKSRSYLPSDKAALLDTAEQILQKRYTDPTLQMGELAAECGISDAYFRRLFRQKHGISPHEYLSRMRITYAAQLLQSGQFSVEQTARLCGFVEPCHFSREFRRRTGCSPAQYKKGEKTR